MMPDQKGTSVQSWKTSHPDIKKALSREQIFWKKNEKKKILSMLRFM